MSKLLIPFLAAACCLSAAPQAATTDAPGVTVSLNGATLLHRASVNYPAEAVKAGVQGTVAVEVKLDSNGLVNDAQVLSGPDELRRPVLQSVLEWHFGREMAGATRVIQVAFQPPKADDVQGYLEGLRQRSFGPMPAEGNVASIRVLGFSEEATAQLLAALPVHEGDPWNAESVGKTNQALKAFDEHLIIRTASVVQRTGGTAEIGLVIEAPGARAETSASVTAGDSVQGAMIIRKVAPIYPGLAKQAGVSGVVHLSAVIGRDGTVQDVQPLGGPQLLIQAAVDAVRQWVYKPVLINGTPAEIKTTIDINFTLNQ